MLRYSYKTELHRAKTQEAMLLLDLETCPVNERAKEKLISVRQEIKFYQDRIDAGLDPGTVIL